MITPELVSDRKKVGAVECSICRSSESSEVKIKRLGRSFGVVCGDCLEEFSDKDLELMHNMFTAFGGYFGKLGYSKEERYKKLEEIALSYEKEGKKASSVESDIKTMHRAFLCGISPVQLVQGLRMLLE